MISCAFVLQVNIVLLKSTLLCVGSSERSLATAAFPLGKFVHCEEDETISSLMDLGGLVSRKKDFVPAVSAAIKKGWSAARPGLVRASKSDVFDLVNMRDD